MKRARKTEVLSQSAHTLSHNLWHSSLPMAEVKQEVATSAAPAQEVKDAPLDADLSAFLKPFTFAAKPALKIERVPFMIDETVTIKGWIDTIRTGKKTHFYVLRQSPTSQVQVVVPADLISKLEQPPTPESYVAITGVVKCLPAEAHSFLPVEIHAHSIDVISLAKSDFPHRCPSGCGPDVQLAQRHLYIRDKKFAINQMLLTSLIDGFRGYFRDSDMHEVIPPSFTSLQCEGGSTLFSLKHPGKTSDKPMDVFLNQSAQFYLEMALAALGGAGTWCVAQSYRAENSHTRRHTTEYTHVEAEWSDMPSIEAHGDRLIQMCKGAISRWIESSEVLLKAAGKYESAQKKLKMLDDVVLLHHKDAITMLRKLGVKKTVTDKDGQKIEVDFDDDDDIEEAQERWLTDKIGKIILLWGFPRKHKSFYMALDPKDQERVLGIDMLVPGVGEIIGSGIRVSTSKQLRERLEEQKLDPATYTSYTDLRDYGFAMTSGMGLGATRTMCWLLDEFHIRDVTMFPRFPGYAAP